MHKLDPPVFPHTHTELVRGYDNHPIVMDLEITEHLDYFLTLTVETRRTTGP